MTPAPTLLNSQISAKDSRVLNLTRGFRLKRKQADRAIEQCACVWVEFGKTVRDCTLAEAIKLRAEQKKAKEPLPFAELPNVIFRMPGKESAIHTERVTAIQANQFARFAATS